MLKLEPIRTYQRAIFVMAFVATCLRPVSLACAQSATEKSTVRDQYDSAQALFAQKNYAGSRKLLLEVWGQRKTADVATSLGQVESRLGHHAEAAKYYAFASANFPPAESVKLGEALRDLLANEKKLVITLEVTSVPQGASVSIDGVEAGVTPLATPLFMEPGMHLVVVKKDGYKLADRSIHAAAGAYDSWEVKLIPVETTSPQASTVRTEPPKSSNVPISPPPELPPASKPNPWILVGGGVITAGALVTGFVFNAKAKTAHQDAASLRDQLTPGACRNPSTGLSPTCDAIRSDANSSDRYRTYSTATFIVAGAASIGTLVYWFWPRSGGRERSGRIRIDGAVAKDGGGVWLKADF